MIETDIAKLSNELGVAIPPSARVVGVERQRGMDDMIRAKVVLPRSALAQFEAALPIEAAEWERDQGALLGEGPSWWNPPPSCRYAQSPMPGARALHVGIDESDPNSVDVYLVNHGT